MADRTHIPFLPVSWAGKAEEFYRRTSTAVNNILKGGPYPPQWRDNTADFNTARVTGASQPTWSAFKDGIYAWKFANGTMNEVHVSFHIDHDQCTTEAHRKLYPHIHWSGDSATNDTVVRFGIEYSFAKGHQQEAFPASTTVYIEQAWTNTDFTHQIAETPDVDAIDLSNLETDGLLLCRVFRDAAHVNDTFDGNCFGLYADLHYQASYFGTPQKAPNFFG